MIEDADPEPAVLRLSNGRDPAVFTTNGLGRAVENADIAVLSPGGHHTFQREFCEFVLMRNKMTEHSIGILAETSASFNSSCMKQATVTLVFLTRVPTIPYHVASRTNTSSTDYRCDHGHEALVLSTGSNVGYS